MAAAARRRWRGALRSHASFHHFADYSRDPSLGAPSLVTGHRARECGRSWFATKTATSYRTMTVSTAASGSRSARATTGIARIHVAKAHDSVDDLHESEGGYHLHVLDAASGELLAQNSIFDESDRRPRSSATRSERALRDSSGKTRRSTRPLRRAPEAARLRRQPGIAVACPTSMRWPSGSRI
jgi:hypothetical protein